MCVRVRVRMDIKNMCVYVHMVYQELIIYIEESILLSITSVETRSVKL